MRRSLLMLALTTSLLGCIKQEIVAPAPTVTVQVSGGERGYYQFTASGTNIETYQWDFGDDRPSTTPNPAHGFDYNQTYTVKLTVANKVGATATATRAVTVTDVRGAVTFWMQSGAYPIDVTIDDTYLDTITKIHAAEPSCWAGSNGAANFTFLKQGVHSYTARQKTTFPLVWKGTFSITGGSCQTLRMNY